ncbi:excinuclease ABC subunit UvrA [candidate division WWE3 bacterium]|uniref:UvrABC system protein A n=1 Tax=candidate division WWE3 bacterium TaxID=2053526 RepID=A0A7X9DJM1_UNCKA|nr:excinuclease ABC subunit UvrA [candidate division WWE3 bacterium]
MKNPVDQIIVKGARQHNLKNVDMEIPKNKMVVFTGVSGSGKSSLAMDTIYAEGQRRYVESLSAYARQFLGIMDKPDVDKIEGLSPAIAIDQKTTSKNPRSTVGTITEVYDYIRLLYARVGHPHCPQCGREIQRQSTDEIVTGTLRLVAENPLYKSEKGVRFVVFTPIIKDRKGEYSTLFENLRKQGILRARVDGEMKNLKDDFDLIKTNKHTIDGLVSRHIVNHKKLQNEEEISNLKSSLFQSLETGLRMGNGNVIVSIVKDNSFDFPENPKEYEDHLFSENFACPVCNISLPDMEPRTFSFNSPHGACPKCDGLGTQLEVDPSLVLNPRLSVDEGGVLPWARLFDHYSWTQKVVEAVSKYYQINLSTPIASLPKEHLDIILYGVKDKRFKVTYTTQDKREHTYDANFEGVIPNLQRRHKETESDYIRGEIERFMVLETCPVCNGSRLKPETLSVTVDKLNIHELTEMSILDTQNWVTNLKNVFTLRESQIAEIIIKEINYRLQFLIDVGLSYLTLSRSSSHLSGGEAQRIRLASQIGSGLSGVLYVLDEPSIGLHQRDQGKLIKTLHHLRDLGNTVLVVEHDAETMLESDYIFDFGPGAGEHGGTIIAEGTPAEIINNPKSLTGQYLSRKLIVGQNYKITKPDLDYLLEKDARIKTKKDIEGKSITLYGANGRNLKNVNFEIPMGKFVCVTGVSGSGKSTLVMDTLYVALRQLFGLKIEEKPEPFKDLKGYEQISNVIAIDQTPIGRTPKSNPATYTKAFDHIRDLYSKTQESRVRGYQSGRFSFNVKGGRCEACGGEGQIKIEMQFMPDVYVNCEVCQGKRYNREALEIYYKGKNIADVLDMTVEESVRFFENVPQIRNKFEILNEVGLGYIRLGQPAPTLSGGEAQRVKLALELSKRSTGSTFYILDEPTTGLHFADLENLIAIIKRLTARGNTVLVIEHNLDVIANSDWVIDLGPEGGEEGGKILFSGTVQQMINEGISYTAQALRAHLGL